MDGVAAAPAEGDGDGSGTGVGDGVGTSPITTEASEGEASLVVVVVNRYVPAIGLVPTPEPKVNSTGAAGESEHPFGSTRTMGPVLPDLVHGIDSQLATVVTAAPAASRMGQSGVTEEIVMISD